MWTFIILSISVFLAWAFFCSRKPKRFPPGPPRLPLIGSIPFIQDGGRPTSLMCNVFHQLKKYGKMCGFYLGTEPVVVLGDYQLIKEASMKEALLGRPRFRTLELARPGSELMISESYGGIPGVIFSHGKYWKELRRFMLRNLRDFGFGKSSMEDLFQEEVVKLNKHLEHFEGKPINLIGMMNISIVNALWSITMSQRMDFNDPEQQQVVNLISKFVLTVTLNGNNLFAAFLPKFMIKWPVFESLSGYKLQKEGLDALVDLMMPYIQEHQETLDPNNARDFLDQMLIQHQTQKNTESCFNEKLGMMTIVNSLLDLFLAGMETTSSSIVMSVLQLLHHPDVQKKVHEELDRVVGHGRPPSLEDKEQLPYVSAVLLESLRVTSLVALGVPRFALEDVELNGYTISKGSIVLPSIYNVHRNPAHFPDPESFNPGRFINADGKFVPNQTVIPFGIGKRYCLGQSLAEKEFFIFFTALLQKFELQKVPGKALPSYIDIRHPDSFLRAPHPFEVILQKRF